MLKLITDEERSAEKPPTAFLTFSLKTRTAESITGPHFSPSNPSSPVRHPPIHHHWFLYIVKYSSSTSTGNLAEWSKALHSSVTTCLCYRGLQSGNWREFESHSCQTSFCFFFVPLRLPSLGTLLFRVIFFRPPDGPRWANPGPRPLHVETRRGARPAPGPSSRKA